MPFVATATGPALRLQNITKRFGEVVALDNVSLTLSPGTVHGILGENGAGKSTLMRIAAGLLRPDTGTVNIDAGSWRKRAVAMVHQHFMLVPMLSVTENCMLGRRDLGQWISRRAMARQIHQLGERLGFPIDPHAKIQSLSVGEQQRAEIIRALTAGSKTLILDEPTAVLTPHESDQLFIALEQLRNEGYAIAFISHKLKEVQRICDELTILRRGRMVYAGPANLNTNEMANHMVGSDIAPLSKRKSSSPSKDAVLELRKISARDSDSHRRLTDVSLSVHAGEIFGIAGVEGNGQDLLAATIIGTIRPTQGQLLFENRDIIHTSVRNRTTAGIAHIAEDRLRQALVPAMTLPENLILKDYASAKFSTAGVIQWKNVRTHAQEQLPRFDVRSGTLMAEARQLSGGNQQKLVLARELSGSPRMIVAQNPVRGLDIAATQFVFQQLLAQAERGAAILLIHSDLDELLSLADRVAVMYDGRCHMTDWPNCDAESIGRRMLGGAP